MGGPIQALVSVLDELSLWLLRNNPAPCDCERVGPGVKDPKKKKQEKKERTPSAISAHTEIQLHRRSLLARRILQPSRRKNNGALVNLIIFLFSFSLFYRRHLFPRVMYTLVLAYFSTIGSPTVPLSKMAETDRDAGSVCHRSVVPLKCLREVKKRKKKKREKRSPKNSFLRAFPASGVGAVSLKCTVVKAVCLHYRYRKDKTTTARATTQRPHTHAQQLYTQVYFFCLALCRHSSWSRRQPRSPPLSLPT